MQAIGGGPGDSLGPGGDVDRVKSVIKHIESLSFKIDELERRMTEHLEGSERAVQKLVIEREQARKDSSTKMKVAFDKHKKEIEEGIQDDSSGMVIVMFCLLFIVVGITLYKKMRDVEKRHLL